MNVEFSMNFCMLYICLKYMLKILIWFLYKVFFWFTQSCRKKIGDCLMPIKALQYSNVTSNSSKGVSTANPALLFSFGINSAEKNASTIMKKLLTCLNFLLIAQLLQKKLVNYSLINLFYCIAVWNQNKSINKCCRIQPS